MRSSSRSWNGLYGAVGYVGVMVAMAIESAMVPLPSELILPYAGFLVSDASQVEPITGRPWSFWIVAIVATIGNTLGSLVAYAIGAGGRPFLERYGRYVIRPPRDRAGRPLLCAIRRGDGVHRPPATGRPNVHLVPGRRGPDAAGAVHRLFDARRLHLVEVLLVFAGEQLGVHWVDIRHALQPFDLAIAVAVVAAVVLFVWWRLGMPGRPGRAKA